MFRGTSNHTIDDKNRLIVPSRFRSIIEAEETPEVMITAWDGALYVYPIKEWNELEKGILSAKKSANMRRFIRVFIGSATKCTLDKNGRFVIPPSLREDATLGKEVSLVGALTRFEIWSQESLESEKAKLKEDLKQEDKRNEIDDVIGF